MQFSQHRSIVGMSGTGKSNWAIAQLIEAMSKDVTHQSGRVSIVDPHTELATCIKGTLKSRDDLSGEEECQ